ncbi:MAG: alanine racemase [Chloroflexi bacterium]|nr:alanine racemase [Chloroflexota bacterium]
MSNIPLPLRPAWVEVNLSVIESNTRRLVDITRGAEVMAIVKANAYGHGAVEVSRAALRGGARWLGVVALGEALELRRANITAPILVTGYTPPDWTRAAVENDVTLTVFTLDGARALADAARALNTNARMHLKVDTGLSRLGVLPEDAVAFARAVNALSNVEIEGVYTHFAVSDTPDAFGVIGAGDVFTQTQLTIFRDVLRALAGAGIRPRYRHCANSPAALRMPDARFDLVRSGILICGLDPDPQVPRPPGFVPALAFKTQVAHVKPVAAGAYVGYGDAFRAPRALRVAIVMVGYADGYRRKLANNGAVLIRGARAPIIGRVCMDQCFADVTEIADAQAGDQVVLIGKQGAEEIRAEEIAEWMGTNNYETVTTISARVERRYVER